MAPRGGEDPLPDVPIEADPPRADLAAKDRVRVALDRLPERYRLPMVLHYVQHLPLQEISEINRRMNGE